MEPNFYFSVMVALNFTVTEGNEPWVSSVDQTDITEVRLLDKTIRMSGSITIDLVILRIILYLLGSELVFTIKSIVTDSLDISLKPQHLT